jgi:ribosome-interacting GTPase 1
MKVFTDIAELLGKKTFQDPRLQKLKERFDSAKLTFYTVEFMNERREICDCIVAEEEKTLDFIVEDLEKAEALGVKPQNQAVAARALEALNKSKFLCDELSVEDLNSIKEYAFITAKPIVIWRNQQILPLCEEIFKKASSIFFFTAGKKEARAWIIKKDTDIVAAAGKIHTDLARGFIRAEIYNVKDLESFKNLEEAKQKGILKVVDRGYIVQDGDVLDIKFSVNR